VLKFRDDFLAEYFAVAPLALVLERGVEARLYRGRPFERPILDVGCGDGLFAAMVFSDNIDVGIDPDRRELEECERNGAYSELIQCWGNCIPRPDGFFGTAFSNSVLEHIPDVHSVLREVHRVLAPGGIFYITVPSERFDEYSNVGHGLASVGMARTSMRFRKWFNNFWRHYHYYSVDGWTQLLRSSGFEVEEAFTYNPRRNCLLNDFLVPFGALAKLTKASLNHWTLFPKARKMIFRSFGSRIENLIVGAERATDGGLVFLVAKKM
jgi:SAM-dependent methyltransferase